MFSILATMGSLELKQMVVGLAVAILLDATIVRGVLLPATMKLFGDWAGHHRRLHSRLV